MTQIQTTRDHDKDMLIAGFKFDLAKARAENERLRAKNARLRAALSIAREQVDANVHGRTSTLRVIDRELSC